MDLSPWKENVYRLYGEGCLVLPTEKLPDVLNDRYHAEIRGDDFEIHGEKRDTICSRTCGGTTNPSNQPAPQSIRPP